MLRLAPSLCLTSFLGIITCFGAQPSATPTPSPTASPAPAVAADPLAALSAADLEKALGFIQKNYVAPSALDPAALDRATLAGLLDRLGRGALLAPGKPAAEPSPAPFYHEIISEHIGYLRPAALRKSDLAELDAALKNFAAKNVDAIILDLRATSTSGDFALAAEFAKRFVPKGTKLFTVRGAGVSVDRTFSSDRSPSYNGFLTVLVDGETVGAAEVLASVLRARDKAILIGQATGGGAVGYTELPLPNGMVLRVASSEALLPEQSATFPHGIEPDLPVTLAPSVKQEVFQQSLTKGMASFIFEEDRPHLNEAALLAGTNPEIEAMQERQARRARGEKPPLHDTVAQRAVDLITSIGVYAKQPAKAP